jgi:hypothetical protein
MFNKLCYCEERNGYVRLDATWQSRIYTGRSCIGYEIATLRNDIFFK